MLKIESMIATIIILLLMTSELTIELVKHGQPREGLNAKYNFWIALISYVIQIILFCFAGLFDCFNK